MAQLLICRLLMAAFMLTGFSFVRGQDYELKQEVDLCSKRPGFEPNGEHLGNPGDEVTVYTNWTNNNPTKVNHCLMRFSTCDNCRLHVKAAHPFYYHGCHPTDAYREYNGWCVQGCTYIHLYDRDYSNRTAMTYTSSSSNVESDDLTFRGFTTESKFLYVIACANKSMYENIFFSLMITAEEKREIFTGSESGENHELTSPFFPSEYVLNSEIYKYVFVAPSMDGFITISFDDWQLSQYSSIIFDSANIKGNIWGSNYRPWIISDSNRLEMTFNTGPPRLPGTVRAFKGFRATYTIHDSGRDDVPHVNTNCGGWVEQQASGQISFNPMANGREYYDCIWIIKKHPDFEWVMVKIVNFSTRDNTYRRNQPNWLEIRRGVTSQGLMMESAVPSTTPQNDGTFHDHDSSSGFYVRLKGHYWGRGDFVLTYTSFNLNQCRGLFACTNGRCISIEAICDGVDNCGDNSDESYDTCGRPPSTGGPTYSSPISVGVIIPIVVSAFLIVVICLLIIFIRRCRRMSCQARQAQRRQGRITTISDSVSRQQRRHNRRRGDQRGEGSGDHLHDPPPSYEDVLNTTPIGYLNLGFSDMGHPSLALIQPPSYDEAVSPTTQAPAQRSQAGEPPNVSSDSSSSETVGRSRLNISSSYSSDDTQRGSGQHRHHMAVSSSSSDSSNEGGGVRDGATDQQRGVTGGHRNREESRQSEGGQSNARYSIAKPEDSHIQLPESSSAELAHNKHVKLHDKPEGQNVEDVAPAVITESLTSSNCPPGSTSEAALSTVCTVETSPMISVPPAPYEPDPAGCQEDEGRLYSAISAASCLPSPADSSHDFTLPHQRNVTSEDQSHAHQQGTSPIRQDAQKRSSPSKQVPAHVRRAKNPHSHMRMKHLSRSMNDLDHQTEEHGVDRRHVSMPSRQFSRSLQNILQHQADQSYRDGNRYPAEADGHSFHHKSQTLPSSYTLAESDGRTEFDPADRQGRRTRSEDFARRTPDQQPSYSHPEFRHRDFVRPQTVENHMNQDGEEVVPPASKPKPKPKPRQRFSTGERTRPEPQRRQFSDNRDSAQTRNRQRLEHPSDPRDHHPDRNQPSQRRTTYESGSNQRPMYPRERRTLSPENHLQHGRGHPADSRENENQNVPGQQSHQKSEVSRPSRPVKPERAPRSSASSGQGPPKPGNIDHGHRQRHQFGGDQRPQSAPRGHESRSHESRGHESRGHESSPPYRHPDPPPYRPRDVNKPHRPAVLHSPTGSSQNTTTHSDGNQAATNSFYSNRDRASRPDCPSQFSPTSKPTGSPSRIGVYSSPRSVQSTESRDGYDARQGQGDLRIVGHTGPSSPSGLDTTTLAGTESPRQASPNSVGTPNAAFLSLRMDGQYEDEDIYV